MSGQYKMGRLPARHDARTLQYADYRLRGGLPMIPPVHTWSDRLGALSMMGNDKYGDCTCAMMGHLFQLWSSWNPPLRVIPDQDIINIYFGMTRGQDTGLALVGVLNHARKFGFDGLHIDSYVNVHWNNPQLVMEAIYLFGAVTIGVMLPDEAVAQFEAGQTWDAGTPNPNNGHAIPAVDYSPDGLTIITWGKLQKITWRWLNSCTEEMQCCISHRWVNNHNVAPNGINWNALHQDIAKVSSPG